MPRPPSVQHPPHTHKTQLGDTLEAQRKWRDALRAVVDAGGTLSHHHGVGRSKAPAMRREQGAAIDVVRALKAILDPAGIFNPGALIGEATDAR